MTCEAAARAVMRTDTHQAALSLFLFGAMFGIHHRVSTIHHRVSTAHLGCLPRGFLFEFVGSCPPPLKPPSKASRLPLLFAVALSAHDCPHEHGGVGQQANVTGTEAHGHFGGRAVVSHAAELDGAGGNHKTGGINLLSMLLSVGRGGERSRDLNIQI